jgi:hypothetical protein
MDEAMIVRTDRPAESAPIPRGASAGQRGEGGPKLLGTPLDLVAYRTKSVTNHRFTDPTLARLDLCFLPPSLVPLTDAIPVDRRRFLEDDNRGAVSPEPVATLDGVSFHLSVKGIGSSVDPFSSRTLDRETAAQLATDPEVRARLRAPIVGPSDRIITGELWLRGSPYGGQGLAHAEAALRVSELANLTSIHGFRIGPVLKVCFLPGDLQERLRDIHWYRRFRGPIVQELRLVPSNVRIYFHARNTVGSNVGHVFDLFGVDSNAVALRFETRFVRSVVAMLTLFARTLEFDASRDRFTGLDFQDVWLDKDAVVAPDGTVYFVDLEGLDRVAVDRDGVREKIEDQVYRSLYEFMFAFEQIENERRRRFMDASGRKAHFAAVVREALRDDPFVRPADDPDGVRLRIGNLCGEESLSTDFPLVDR